MVISERTETTFFALDFGHWLKVRKAREAAGLPVGTSSPVAEANPLLGRRFPAQSDEPSPSSAS